MPVARATCHCAQCPSRTLGIFSPLSPQELRELDQEKVTDFYERGQVIFYEGNHALGLYCLAAGRVKLFKAGHLGRHVIVRIVNPGGMLGYRGFFAEEPYAATAVAMEDSTVCFFEKSAILSSISRNPLVALKVIKTLSQELGVAETKVLDLVDKSVQARLAGVLLALKDRYGKAVPLGTHITLTLTREELAEMVGTTQETTIRCLSKFKERGMVELSGQTILIKDADGLQRLSRLPF